MASSAWKGFISFKGRELAATLVPHRAPVIDMMAALKKSLAASPARIGSPRMLPHAILNPAEDPPAAPFIHNSERSRRWRWQRFSRNHLVAIRRQVDPRRNNHRHLLHVRFLNAFVEVHI